MKPGLTRWKDVEAKHKAYCDRIRKQAEKRINELVAKPIEVTLGASTRPYTYFIFENGFKGAVATLEQNCYREELMEVLGEFVFGSKRGLKTKTAELKMLFDLVNADGRYFGLNEVRRFPTNLQPKQ